MKLLLDEHLSKHIAKDLRKRGHDVAAVQESDRWIGMNDESVFAMAMEQDRAVVTNNVRDFRPIAAERNARGHPHYGLILLASTYRRTRADAVRIANELERVMRENPGETALKDREIWI